jgi:hypothetical protein
MIVVKARKKLSVKRILCVLELMVRERCPDIAWLLRTYQKDGLSGYSTGERENMEDYLEYLDLVRDGRLTQDGDKAKNTEQVMIPEAGLYEIWCTHDRTFGDHIIFYSRQEPWDVIEGEVEDFDEYELLDEKMHVKLAQGGETTEEFRVKFLRKNGEVPKICMAGEYDADLELIHENGETKLKFSLSHGPVRILHEEKFVGFTPEDNVSRWVKDWNSRIAALEVEFADAEKDSSMLNYFRMTKRLEGQRIFLPEGITDENWQIDLTVPVVPKRKKDADDWVCNLIKQDLTANPRYLSIGKLEELEKSLLGRTTILGNFKGYFQSGSEIMKFLRGSEEKDSYDRIMAVEDLLVSMAHAREKA